MSASQGSGIRLPSLLSSDIWHPSVLSNARQLRLIFEGGLDFEGIEITVPLIDGLTVKKIPVQKRPFTRTSNPFPFDLSTTYPTTSKQWFDFSKEVYDWLSHNIKERQTDEWRWALNFFWICYAGAAPNFPFKPKFPWSSDIAPFSGEFLTATLSARILTNNVPLETGATLVYRLVEWLRLREKWMLEGVSEKESQRISMWEGGELE